MKTISFRIMRSLLVSALLLAVACPSSPVGAVGARYISPLPVGSILPMHPDRLPPLPADTTHYLLLSVTPAIVTPGTLVTLHITYHNVGLPLTYISIVPSENLAYEPEIAIPCYGCSDVTLRVLKTGVVRIHATASGEIFDDGCHCWVFTMVPDNGPAVLHVLDQLWTVFLPAVGR